MVSIETIVLSQRASLREAMRAVEDGGVGIALVLSKGMELLGTVTDGDFRRGILRGVRLDDRVDRVMQRQFVSVSMNAGRAEVLDLMRARTLRQIPVVDDQGKISGLHLLREMIGAVERSNWAVVMAGGRGERLRPITDTIPKPMVHVAGRPILERIVLHLLGFGVSKIFLAVNYMGDVIEEHFGDGSSFGCQIDYLREDSPQGTGGALSLLPDEPSDPMVVLNGDLLTQVDIGSLMAFHAEGAFSATIGLREYVHRVPFGVVEMLDNQVVDIREKPSKSWTANCGIYVIQPELVRRVPRGEYFTMPDLMGDCLRRGDSVGGYLVEGDWMDIGRPTELQRARGEDVAP